MTRTKIDHESALTDQSPCEPSAWGSAVVAAFACALVVAVVALVVSAPAIRLGGAVAGPLLILAWLGTSALAARRVAPKGRVPWSALAGVTAAALLLIFLGSLLTEPVVTEAASTAQDQAVARLRPAAPLLAAGFLALGSVIGALGGVLAGFMPPARSSAWPWTARLALVTTAATLPLILLGGLVTSTESGMAVPDWPGSYGANMVLFPLGLMAEPRIFLEHSHRLFGMLVGVATIATALSVAFARTTPRAPAVARAVAWAAVPMVVVQGVLGGTRVTENSPALAVLHGILAQVFFMTVASLVAMLVPAWDERQATHRGVARLAKVYLSLLFIQLVLGALFRHLGERSAHPLYAHIALALVIVILAAILGPRLAKAAAEGRAPAATRRIGKAIAHSTAFQFFLGFGALAGAMMGSDRGPIPLHSQLEGAKPVPAWEVILTTLHQANGAVLLVMAGLAVVWTVGGRRGADSAPDVRGDEAGPGPLGTVPAPS